MEKQNTNLKAKIIISVIGVIILVSILVSYSEYHIEFDQLYDQQIADIHKAEWLLDQEIENQALLFSGLMDSVCQNTTIQQAFINNDRQTLLELSEPIFKELKPRYNITHFYFHQLDKKCFLRVHNPSRFGDVITRKTLANATRQSESSYGLEVGPFGTFALRYVCPWRVNGELIGYIELGEDMEPIARNLKQVLGCEFAIMVNKSFVNREDWQEGLKMLGRTGDWNLLEEAVLTGSTFKEFPNELHDHIRIEFNEKICEHAPLVKVGNRKYFAGCFGLFDVNENHVGRMLVVQDMSIPISVINTSTAFFGALVIVAGFLASLFFYFYIGQIERRLKKTDRKQREEIANRRVAEAQLNEARRHIEKAYVDLQQTQEKLSLHIKNTPLGVIQWSPELVAESWNPTAEKLFGYTAEEAIGRSANDLIIPEDVRQSVDKTRRKLLTSTESSTNRNENVTRDGRRIMCQWHNTPLIDANGKVIGISSIVQDITKTLKYEQRLQNAKEQAEAANRSKSMFMAKVSHELRTPMNAIIGFSDLLRNEGLNDEQLDYATTIYQSAHHLLSLINDVLDISKIEAGKLDIVKETCQIRPMLQQIQSMMQPVAGEHQINFELIIRDSLPEEIVTDGKRLHQCLVNLIGNAMKFTEKGSVKLRAGVLDSDANPWAYFEVRDTGIGIPTDRLDKVFESFEQADANIGVKYGGTGLGLSISRQLIEQMGGALTVESQEGVGSTFTITLPLEPLTETSPQSMS